MKLLMVSSLILLSVQLFSQDTDFNSLKDSAYTFGYDMIYYDGEPKDIYKDGIYKRSHGNLLKYSTKTGDAVRYALINVHEGTREVYGSPQRQFNKVDNKNLFYPKGLFSEICDGRNAIQVVHEHIESSKFNFNLGQYDILVGVNVYTGKSQAYSKKDFEDWKKIHDWKVDYMTSLADNIHPVKISIAKQTGDFFPRIDMLAYSTFTGKSLYFSGSVAGKGYKGDRTKPVGLAHRKLMSAPNTPAKITPETPIQDYNYATDGPIEARMLSFAKKTGDNDYYTYRQGLVFCTRKTGKVSYWQSFDSGSSSSKFSFVRHDKIDYQGDQSISDWTMCASDEYTRYHNKTGVEVIFYSPSKKELVGYAALKKDDTNLQSAINRDYRYVGQYKTYEYKGDLVMFNFCFELIDGDFYYGVMAIDDGPKTYVHILRHENTTLGNKFKHIHSGDGKKYTTGNYD